MCCPTNPTTIACQLPIQFSEQPKASRKRRRATVRFASNDNISQISSVSDESTWYNQDELKSFRKEASSSSLSSPIVQFLLKESMKRSRSSQIDEKEVLYQIRRRKYVAVQAVLEAQRRLKNMPEGKEEKLALVGSKFSNWAREIALRVASVDLDDSHSNSQPCKRQRLESS